MVENESSPLAFRRPLSPLSPLLLFSPHHRCHGPQGTSMRRQNCRSTRGVSPQTPRTNAVGCRFRGPQRTVRGGGQAAPIPWRSVPMTPISAQLPPHPPLVAGISLHITWTRQMESRNLQRAAKVSKSSAASSLVHGWKSPLVGA
jgi:hypothetical protein